MKTIIFISLLSLASSLGVSAQKPSDVLAKVDGLDITAVYLPAEARDEYLALPKTLAEVRGELFESMVSETLLGLEAASRKISVRELAELEISKKSPEPTAEQIQRVYDENRGAFGPRTLDDVRSQIANYLRARTRDDIRRSFVESLKPKFKFVPGKDVASAAQGDVLVTIDGKPVTRGDFESRYAAQIFETEASVYDNVIAAVEYILFNGVLSSEAKSLNVDAGDIIAREITDKMRSFTPEERAALETGLRNRLFAKYKVEMLVKAPRAPILKISVEGEPSIGPASAPVTVVMFSDFECPSCAAAHPVLKRVIGEFGDKVRFVVKDFPLETIHPQALPAAAAASAAAKQGRYFEYVDLLYKNQGSFSREAFKSFAASIGLNMQRFEVDFTDSAVAEEARKDYAEGESLGVDGTPSIFVNGVKLRRGLSAETLRASIKSALDSAAAK